MNKTWNNLLTKIENSKPQWIDAYINNLEINDNLYSRPITKITDKCVYINPTCPTGKIRYTKKEIKSFYDKRKVL